MKKKIIILPLLLLPWCLSCCSSNGDIPAESQATAQEFLLLLRGEKAPAFKSGAAAYGYVRQQLQGFPKSILLRLQSSSPSAEATSLCQQLQLKEGLTTRIRYVLIGKVLSIEPEYADDALMLRAFRHPEYESSLEERQKRALGEAKRWVSSVCARYASDYDRALALHDELIGNTSYQKGLIGLPRASAATTLLLERRGVCEGYTRTYRLLLDMAGIENKYLVGEARGRGHSWNMLKLEGQWVHVDCTYDDPLPDVPGRTLHTYFGMPDTLIARTHSWNRHDCPVSGSLSLYYPVHKGLRFKSVESLISWCRQNPRPHRAEELFYVDELASVTEESHLRRLIEQALARASTLPFAAFSWDPELPCVINCQF